MITLDTSAIIALLDRVHCDHEAARRVVEADPGPYLVAAGILAQAAFMLQSRFVAEALPAFLADLDDGAYTLVCGEEDLARVRELVQRDADLPLWFSDAVVIACAEGAGRRLAHARRRDFEVVARETPLELLP